MRNNRVLEITALPALKVSRVRPFTAEDIPQVAELHRKVIGVAERMTSDLVESYRAYFTQVYLNNPSLEEPAESIVYEEKSGKITGFLAVFPRRMSFEGQVVRARITSQFVVDPDYRGIVGLKLLGTVLAGPQDLTIADESNANSRKLWEGLGGSTSHLYSMRWLFPLRPSQFAVLVADKTHLLPARVSSAAAPVAKAIDALGARALKNYLQPAAPKFSGERLDCETLEGCLFSLGARQSIKTDHDRRSLIWALQRASQLTRYGSLQKVLVKTEKQEIAGWYIYYANPRGLSEVIQLHAKPEFTHEVLGHLFHHAWHKGAIGLSGRMEPAMMGAFEDKRCLFQCGPHWVLIHSRRPELLHAFNRGNAGFTRLDGEWCLHFR